MTNEEFERIWQENRNRVLANDDEYQRISKSYTNWGWTDYLILILGFVMCENFTKSLGMNIILQYLRYCRNDSRMVGLQDHKRQTWREKHPRRGGKKSQRTLSEHRFIDNQLKRHSYHYFDKLLPSYQRQELFLF